jgi:hypothetical protein
MEQAIASGAEIAPSDVARHTNAPVPGSTIQGITETPAVAAERNLRNTDWATQKGAKDIGLPPTTIITDKHIAAANKAPGAIYDATGQAIPEVRNVNPKTLQVLEDTMADATTPNTVKRDMARMITGLKSGQYTGTHIMQDISSLREAGQTVPGLRVAANALESEMEAQLVGQPETLAAYKGARETFAKIQDVKDSLKGGRIDPQALLRLQEGPRARPLSKGLAEVAHAASVAPDSVKMPGAVSPEGLPGHTPYGLKYGLIAKGIKGAVRAVAPRLNTPERQAAMAGAAPSPGPLPGPPGRGPLALGNAFGDVGVPKPTQLELNSAGGQPMPSGTTPKAGLPQATAPLNLGEQLASQVGLRGETMPGRAVGDNGPTTATRGAGVPGVTVGRSGRANLHEEGAVPARVRELLQAILEARRRGQ